MNGRIDTQPQSEIVWRPQAGPQKALVDCSVPEVFFGGARGGGKTDGVLGKWKFNAVGFRRTSVSFEDAIDRAKQIYVPLGAKFVDRPARFKMPNGGRVSFSYLENTDDAQEYQGRNLSDAWVEEAGQYVSSDPIDRLFGVLRAQLGDDEREPMGHQAGNEMDVSAQPIELGNCDRAFPVTATS